MSFYLKEERAERVFYPVRGCMAMECPRSRECLRASSVAGEPMSETAETLCQRGIIPAYVPRRVYQ
jgi:hypothetical protein